MLTWFSMVALIYSSIVLSRYVFSVLPIEGGMVLARRFHILGSYWGFLLMNVHLGMIPFSVRIENGVLKMHVFFVKFLMRSW